MAVLVVLLLAACATNSDSGASAPETVPGDPSLPATTQPLPVTTATTTPDDDLARASQAFLTWVDHLAEGDHQAAWDAMAPASQTAVGEEVFFDSMVFEMSEGWGSWSAAGDIEFRLETDGSGRTLLWVSGTISPEGMTEEREVAVPIVESDGGYLVSPFEGPGDGSG
ncbi:MAG: hypothetical protein ACLFWM_01915 [Actinomycetota bacterium]